MHFNRTYNWSGNITIEKHIIKSLPLIIIKIQK